MAGTLSNIFGLYIYDAYMQATNTRRRCRVDHGVGVIHASGYVIWLLGANLLRTLF